MKEQIDDELTYKIIGCAMKVHTTSVNRFQEVIYQRALAIEMKKEHLNFMKEFEIKIFYDVMKLEHTGLIF